MKKGSSIKRGVPRPVRDTLTQDEQRKRTEDMALKRCAEIKRQQRERKKAAAAAKRALAKRRTFRYGKRCKPCPAMSLLTKNGKKKPK